MSDDKDGKYSPGAGRVGRGPSYRPSSLIGGGDAALVHDDRFVADAFDLREDMGTDENRAAPLPVFLDPIPGIPQYLAPAAAQRLARAGLIRRPDRGRRSR